MERESTEKWRAKPEGKWWGECTEGRTDGGQNLRGNGGGGHAVEELR